MRIEMVSGFLLPAGVWLIVSAGTPLQAQRRLASATLIALATALLAFAAFGFALMFGGSGASGFLLNAAAQPSVLALFIQALPLVLTCAVLVTGALSQRARPIAQLILIVVTCGIALSLAGGWLWTNGWLHMLGASDIGQLAVVGLVAGGAGLAWLLATPRREQTHEPQLPEAALPPRAVAGVLLTLTGMAGVLMATDADVALRQFTNSAIAVAAAIITAGAYTAFTTRNADTLSASRAMLAAIFISSAGAAMLPTSLVAGMGIACGLSATLGFYWVNEKQLLDDESALVTAVLLPAVAGMVIAGAVAGASALIAQVVAVAAMTLLAFALAWLTLRLARALRWPVLAAPAQITSPPPAGPIHQTQPALEQSENAEAQGVPSNEPAPNTTPQKQRGFLAWLRRNPTEEASPKQPRKVAYPYRIGGRRMSSRPIASEPSPVDGTPTIDAS